MPASLAKRPEDWLEDELDRHLFRGDKSLAKMTGWMSYHTLRSRGSRAGYPDRTCVRERVLYAELKREKSKPTPDQVQWLDALARAHAEVYLWRPGDLDEIGKVLGYRWAYDGYGTLVPLSGTTTAFDPGTLWVAGEGRRDGH